MCGHSGGCRFPDRLCCLFIPVSLGKTLPLGSLVSSSEVGKITLAPPSLGDMEDSAWGRPC